MEPNKPKFRFRLNLFDSIVLVLALAVGAFLVWSSIKPAKNTVPWGKDTARSRRAASALPSPATNTFTRRP